MTKTDDRIALVTGANKGLRFATCIKLAQIGIFVLMGLRNIARGKAAQQCLSGRT